MSVPGKTMAPALLWAALGCAALSGCDASRPALEEARRQVAALSTERDGLRKELAVAQAEVAAARKAAQAAAPRGEAVKYEVHSGYFESNRSGLSGDASFLAISGQGDFDQIFGAGAVMGGGQRFLPKDALSSKIAVAVIHRGASTWQYTVERVAAEQGILYVHYRAKEDPGSGGAKYASPLILSVDKGPYASVGFIENGKLAGTASIGN